MIAYSTMSQIGYMIMGVSVAAYGAGIFHLMTHAFFKALLFMGAGSVIGAMAGEQSMDKMGGFKKAMPFTYATFLIGALALSGFPLMSGFFSKDEILAYTINRGGWFVVLGVVGYVAALLTAFYAFRMVFRVFHGKAVPEAEELEGGHLHHGEHSNPATGEPEDTDVGFPGPEHAIAERAMPMKAAMGPLAVLAIIAGALGIPGVTDTLEHFLEPTFADSKFHDVHPSTGAEWSGLLVGGVIAVIGIGGAFFVFVKNPALRTPRARALPRACTRCCSTSTTSTRPSTPSSCGRPSPPAASAAPSWRARSYRASWWAAPPAWCAPGTSFARSIQTGELRAYAGLLIMGVGGTVLYFLVVST